MSKLSRTTALELIANWSTDEVIEVLKKNGQEECCQAVLKRQIDGDELLHLTEGKLTLWKSDLSRPQIWNLWNFVEEIRRSPEDYVSPQGHQQIEEPVSDSGSWGSDFDADEDESHNSVSNSTERSTNFRNSLLIFEKQGKVVEERKNTLQIFQSTGTNESIYMNCESEEENAYMNLESEKLPEKSVSNLQNKFENVKLSEKLKEELTLITKNKFSSDKKPELRPKPISRAVIPSKSTVQKKSLRNPKEVPKKPKEIPKKSSICPEKIQKIQDHSEELPRPPMMLRNFDLVANLPTKTEESDDEYESFDEQIIEQNQKKFGSKQSVQGSIESVYKPSSSTTSQEKEDDSEIYECITETPEDNGYIEPIPPPAIISPPPLPSKPNMAIEQFSRVSIRAKQNKNERSPEKKTIHSGSTSALSEMRATRPLPPPPDRLSYCVADSEAPKIDGPFSSRAWNTRMDYLHAAQSKGTSESSLPYTEAPWFHNVTREQATKMIKERPHNGYFLMRPSYSNPNNPLVLVVWFKDRVYNVPVRRRPDKKYALGTPKDLEQTFTTVEEIVPFYSREDVKLQSNGEEKGLVKLTDSPQK